MERYGHPSVDAAKRRLLGRSRSPSPKLVARLVAEGLQSDCCGQTEPTAPIPGCPGSGPGIRVGGEDRVGDRAFVGQAGALRGVDPQVRGGAVAVLPPLVPVGERGDPRPAVGGDVGDRAPDPARLVRWPSTLRARRTRARRSACRRAPRARRSAVDGVEAAPKAHPAARPGPAARSPRPRSSRRTRYRGSSWRVGCSRARLGRGADVDVAEPGHVVGAARAADVDDRR